MIVINRTVAVVAYLAFVVIVCGYFYWKSHYGATQPADTQEEG